MSASERRVDDIGIVDPKEVKDGTAYAYFGGFILNSHPIDERTGHSVDVAVPVPVAALEAAGVRLDNPDPYDNPKGWIAFRAYIVTPAETVEDADPRDIRPVPHFTQDGIDAWEGRTR